MKLTITDIHHDLRMVAATLEAVAEDMQGDPAAIERARVLQIKCTKRLREIIAEVSKHVIRNP